MSSILEALKELERDRAKTAKKATSVADVPSAPPRSYGALIALAGCLAIGVVALGAYRWGAGAHRQQPTVTVDTEQPPAAAADQASGPSRGPEWLGRAEPPRARLAPAPAPPATTQVAVAAPTQRAPVPTAPQPVVPPAASAPTVAPVPAEPAVPSAPIERAPVARTVPAAPAPAVAPRPRRAATTATGRAAGNQQVLMEALAFSSHVHRRTVTLLVDGQRATLHQGESLGGVEVQLIMADGAYLQRGADVFFIGKPR